MRLVTYYTADSPEYCAYEETIIKFGMEKKIPDTMWIPKTPKGVYLLRNASANFLNFDYARDCGYQIVRGGVVTSKTTSLLVGGFSFGAIASLEIGDMGEDEYIDKYCVGLWRHVVSKYTNLKIERVKNDILVAGTDRKLYGMSFRKDETTMGSHGAFSTGSPPTDVDFNKLLVMPPSKFEDKEVKSPSSRITSLFLETGRDLTREEVALAVKEYLETIGYQVDLVEQFSLEEQTYMQELLPKHRDERWLKYGRKI